jgi:apolipoprotein N-acyltransferase
MGLVERESKGGRLHYYNSAVSIGMSPSQTYRKQHLVPFGEYIPAKPLLGWVSSVLKIPFADMSPGTAASSLLHLQGAKVAVNICFENAFGEEILDALPEATVLVNMSNLAWFGKSLALPQHVQISQMRAAETGRYMLSATNTGYTAIINQRGHIMRQAPGHEALVLTGDAQGFEGATPYVRFGNIPVVMFAIMGIIVGVIGVAGAHRRSPNSLNAGANARASQQRGSGPSKE